MLNRIEVPFEVKLASDGTSATEMKFSGLGAVFGNVDTYEDVIQEGAFAKSLKESRKSGRWPAMLLQHGGWGLTSEDMMPVGVWEGIEEIPEGLKSDGILADIQRGRDAYTLMKMKPRPAIDGLSIGYRPIKFKMRDKPEEPRRLITEAKLFEISLVTFPANDKARVSDVKQMDMITSLADAERYLRDACGLSRREALAFVSRVASVGQTKGSIQSDSDAIEELRGAIAARGKSLILNK